MSLSRGPEKSVVALIAFPCPPAYSIRQRIKIRVEHRLLGDALELHLSKSFQYEARPVRSNLDCRPVVFLERRDPRKISGKSRGFQGRTLTETRTSH
jgi:hypothetical protein